MRKNVLFLYKKSCTMHVIFCILQGELITTGVCTGSRAKTVVEEFMIPLVGDRQRIYEQNLETMEVQKKQKH